MSYQPSHDLTGKDLGGMTLTPGVYHFDTSAGLTGNLTLDTGSDPNAVFVFQIGSTLTTATGSSLVVTGAGAGTTPNIFWQVGSSATLNSGTSFSGNILALASVSLGTGSDLTNGRLLALNGAVTLLSNSISSPATILAAPGRFWNGTSSQLWSEANWSTTAAGADQVNLGAGADVVFSVDAGAKNQNTILDTNTTISSLTIKDSVAVTIAGPNTLTIASTGLNTGINVNAGAGFTTISSNLELGNLSQVIDVNNTDGMLISGVISGTNGLTKAGTGVLTLTGAETYTGATVVSEGVLRLGDGVTAGTSIASSDSVLISPNGVLVIKLDSGEVFGNSVTNNGRLRWAAPGTNTQSATSVISGTGKMTMFAPGKTILLGTNTFSGGTTIKTNGEVYVGNPLLNTSSAFGTGVLNIRKGTVDTNNSQLLQINVGGYKQSGGEIAMHLEGTAPGTYTQYNVTGTANLTAGKVFVYDMSGNYVPSGGDTQNIIHTTGGLTGQFASNFPKSSFHNDAFNQNFFYHKGDTLLYPTLTYQPDNANVTWVQDSFQSIPGLTHNQNAVGHALDSYASQNPGLPGDVIAYLNGQNISALPGLYNRIAPEELTAMFQMGFSAAEIEYNNIERHLQMVRAETAIPSQSTRSTTDSKGVISQETVTNHETNRWSVFVEGTGGSASVSGGRNARGYDYDTAGGTLGADMRLSDSFVFGILGSYTNGNANLVNGGSIDAETFKGAVYATYYKDGFYVDGLIGAGHNSYDTRRASLLGFATGSTEGWEFDSLVNLGYDIHAGNWTFGPTASVAYTRVAMDSFTESGSLTPLRFSDQDQDSLRTELGGKIAYSAVFNGMTITPQVRVAWQHEFLDRAQSITSSFAGGAGPSFTVDGPHTDRDRAVLSAGVSAKITPTLTIYGFYDGQLGNTKVNSNQVSAGIKLDF